MSQRNKYKITKDRKMLHKLKIGRNNKRSLAKQKLHARLKIQHFDEKEVKIATNDTLPIL